MAESKTKKTKKTAKETATATTTATIPEGEGEDLVEGMGEDEGMELMAILLDHGSAVNLEPREGETTESFQARIIEKINSVPDDMWKTLPKATQLWFNDVVRSMRETRAKETKADREKKKTLQKAKSSAKEATAKEIGTGFIRGSNAWNIMKIVQDNAGENGMTMEEIIEIAKKQSLQSSNIPGRCRQIVKNGASRKDQYGGFIEVTDEGKYRYIGRDLNKDPEPTAKKTDKPKTDKSATAKKTDKPKTDKPKTDKPKTDKPKTDKSATAKKKEAAE